MNKLVLKSPLELKLDRLIKKVGHLTYEGNDPNDFASKPIVAIVGSRKPTPYGKQMTEKLAAELSRAGVVIVSGLAFGVDSIAHKAVLEAGGVTIAVLPSGLQAIYPASHAHIAKQIIEHGCLISEYELDRVPRKVEFLERNRIIAALSDIVIVTEAAEKSGSLNTAKHAKSMGIPVFALPGLVTSTQSAGTNWLIQNGANLLASSNDILLRLGINKRDAQTNLFGANDSETLVLQAIANGIIDNNSLETELAMTTGDILTALTMLEIAGRITQDSFGNWQLS